MKSWKIQWFCMYIYKKRMSLLSEVEKEKGEEEEEKRKS